MAFPPKLPQISSQTETMRKSTFFITFIFILMSLVGLTLVDISLRQKQNKSNLNLRLQLVKELGLTDFALFTEARYTRHITQADLHSAFQDHPMAMEHFPSGSLIMPPKTLTQGR